MRALGPGHPAALLSTWFGIGLLPMAPGTWGSIAALPFAWAIGSGLGSIGLAVAGVLLFLIGIWASGAYAEKVGVADPPEACIDEVAAMWLLLAILPMTWLGYGLGLVTFRVADVLKPWPAGLIDRRVPGGLGIMLDDVAVLPYAGAAAWLGLWAAS
jgi:phosphatidylglycerophosphatase A